jgi:MFS transporter, FSR family, fosmidomycin resistance protein
LTRPVRVLTVIHAVNDGTVVLLPTLFPIATSLFGIGYEKLGILVASGYIASVIVQPIAGKYSERIEPKNLLAAGIGTMAFSMIIIAYAPSYFILLLGAVVLRTGSSFYHPVATSVISKIEFRQSLDKHMGVLSAFGDLGSLLIFLGAAVLYSFLGWRGPFLIFFVIDFSIAIGVLVFLQNFHERNNRNTTQIVESKSDWRKDYGLLAEKNLPNKNRVLSSPPISFLFLATFVSSGSCAIILNFANSLLAREYGSVLFADLLVGFWLATFVLGDLLTGSMSKRIGRTRFLLIAYAISAILIGIFSLSTNYIPLTSISLVGSGFALSFTFPLIYSELGSRPLVSKRGTGTTFGLLFSSQIIGSAVLSYLSGELSEFLGPLYPFAVAAIMLSVVAALGSFILRSRSGSQIESAI